MSITADRNDIASRLLSCAGNLAVAEREIVRAQRILSGAKEDLADAEAALFIEGVIGKNEAERNAHVRLATTPQREAVRTAEEDAREAALWLRTLQAEHSSLRSVARLLSGENSD